MSKIDLRIVKTKKLLRKSLVDLLKEKSFDNITITDICNKALINRSTFYSHFNDKYELLVDLFEAQRLQLLEYSNDDDNKFLTKDSFLSLISNFIDLLDERKEICGEILSHEGNRLLYKCFVDMFETNITKRIKINEDIDNSDLPVEYAVKFYVAGIIDLLLVYMTNGISKKDLLRYYDLLIPELYKN